MIFKVMKKMVRNRIKVNQLSDAWFIFEFNV